MKPDYFDIHSHLNFPQYDADRDQVIAQLNEHNIWTITVGTGLKTSKEAIALAEQHGGLFATVGLHPADDATETFSAAEYDKLAAHEKVVAIGECGLDYFRTSGDTAAVKIKQKAEFEQQIELAVRHDKPLMIHCREAYPDVLDILSSKKKAYGNRVRGNFHFFTSPIDIARKCLDIGFTLSLTGPITYGSDYDELVRFIPLESLMTETDAPYAAPVPHRGKRNNPAYVVEVVKKIAVTKGIALDEVQKKVVENAFRLFFSKTS